MKSLKLNKKTALVTGAASGLGFEFSKLLVEDSYNLIIVDVNKELLLETKNYIQSKYNLNVKIIHKDLSKINAPREIFESISTPIDILINNAGFGLFGSFNKTSWQRELEMLNLHIITTTQLTKLFLEGMINRDSGRILNVSSLAAFQPGPLMSIYYASKAYILSFSEALANELKGTGVTVTTLCPGPTKTRFQEVVSNNSSKNRIQFNMASARSVANIGYMAMLQGKKIVIPGMFNNILAFLPRVLPRQMVTSIVRKIQEKNRDTKLFYKNI